MSRLTDSIRLPDECIITTIPDHHAAMKAALANSSALSIDVSDVIKFDLSLIQLLISAAKTAQTLGKPSELVNCSDDFATSLRHAGVAVESLGRVTPTT